MLIIAQTRDQIKPAHTDALAWQIAAYRAAKALGWTNTAGEMHPTDRVPVFRLAAMAPQSSAAIWRDRSGQADWNVEANGQTCQISTTDLDAITAELLASETEADPFDAITDATLRQLAADLTAEGYDQGRAIRAALIVEADGLDIAEQDATTVRATCVASDGNLSANGLPYYQIDFNGVWSCDCPDREFRSEDCKHILAGLITRRRDAEADQVAQRKLADKLERAAKRNRQAEAFDAVAWALKPQGHRSRWGGAKYYG